MEGGGAQASFEKVHLGCSEEVGLRWQAGTCGHRRGGCCGCPAKSGGLTQGNSSEGPGSDVQARKQTLPAWATDWTGYI